jgi:hypothetical protein
MLRLDYDQDGYLSINDFTMLYSDESLLNFNPNELRRAYLHNQSPAAGTSYLKNLRYD